VTFILKYGSRLELKRLDLTWSPSQRNVMVQLVESARQNNVKMTTDIVGNDGSRVMAPTSPH